MTDTKQSRGRPKGTGIDDRIWLREMERLMRIDPALRPTSAIKALGITDPSTIRRLRDKHAARHGQDATSHQAEQPARESASARHRVAVQQAMPDPVIRRRPALVASNPGPASKPEPAAAAPQPQSPPLAGAACADPFSLMLGLGVQTMLLCAQATTTMMLAVARQSPASLLFQQQLAASDAFAAAIRQQFDARARALDR